jgi:transposase
VLERTRQAPPDGSTHWSLRKMAAVMKVSKNLIGRIWKEADLKPHRLERYMASNDPHFEQKAAAIIGLYLNPPQNAAVFCVDEKSAIQALDRLDRRLPLSPGRAERHGFEYYRHGTLSLYAALNPQTGQLMGQTAARHTSQEFVAFLEEIVATQPAEREVHVILDNFSAHRTALVNQFLQQHPNVQFHFTPTYSSWLNQVESWFSKLQRDVIDRGIFTSVADLKRKIMRYIRLYQKTAKPFRWKYSDIRKRIPAC